MVTPEFTTSLRRCSKCRQELPATEEYFWRDHRPGRTFGTWCKDCKRAYTANRNRDAYVPKPKRVHPNDLLVKLCSSCKVEKPNNELHFRLRTANSKKWLNSQCIECEALLKKERREKNTDGYLNELAQKRKQQVLKYARSPRYREAEIQRARRRVAKLVGSYTAKELKAKYDEQGGLCFWCKVPIDSGFERDHVIPVSKGGKNDISNIVCACRSCNRSKSAKMPAEWVSIMGKKGRANNVR